MSLRQTSISFLQLTLNRVMHGKVALWEGKQNGFEILMRYNMIQGPLRNRRDGLHAAESTQTSNEKPYALILYLTKHPRNHQTLYPAAGAGHGNTLLYEEQTKPCYDLLYCHDIL